MATKSVSNLRKFQVLTWKAFITKIRHYVETALDIIIPSLLFIILVVLRFKVADFSPEKKPAIRFHVDNFLENARDDICYPIVFLYSPMTSISNETVGKMDRVLQTFYEDTWCNNHVYPYRIGKFRPK